MSHWFLHLPEFAQSPETSAAAEAAQQFVRKFHEGRRGLLFYGRSGAGKTHLTTAILRYLVLNLGIRVRFVEFLHLLGDLRAAFGKSGGAVDIMHPLVEVPVLAIDELGKGKEGEWELDVLDELIGKRYNARRTTLFTTNCRLTPNLETRSDRAHADLLVSTSNKVADKFLEDRIGVRIYSRLREMCEFYAFSDDDRRQRSG